MTDRINAAKAALVAAKATFEAANNELLEATIASSPIKVGSFVRSRGHYYQVCRLVLSWDGLAGLGYRLLKSGAISSNRSQLWGGMSLVTEAEARAAVCS